MKSRGKAISSSTAVILTCAILVVAIASGLTLLRPSPSSGAESTNTITSSSYSTTLIGNQASCNSQQICASSTSSSESTSSDPSFAYIWTNNTQDIWGTSIHSALDTNTGQTAWVFESGYHDSVLLIENNQVVSNIGSFYNEEPTGIAFDSRNNLAYITYGIPGECISCPYGVSAISGNQIVSTNLSLSGWPAGIAYDQQFDYLYVSYVLNGVHSEQGIGVIDPNTGAQLAYIPSGDYSSPASFAYDPLNGEMFAAVPHYGGNTTIFVLNGSGAIYTFQVTGTVSNLVFAVNDGYLYLSRGNDIVVVNPGNGNAIGTIQIPSTQAIVYDTINQYVCAFGPTELRIISGTTITSQRSIPYNVTSVLYDLHYSDILAFY